MSDLIERQTALDALGERPIVWTDDDQYTLGERNQYDIDRLVIETLPSAQPERKKGKWITRKDVAPYRPDGEITSWTYKCEYCGTLSRLKYNYCYNCGAKMDEVMKDE